MLLKLKEVFDESILNEGLKNKDLAHIGCVCVCV